LTKFSVELQRSIVELNDSPALACLSWRTTRLCRSLQRYLTNKSLLACLS